MLDAHEAKPADKTMNALEPECFGEKMGNFEINTPNQYHDQGEQGTCTSHAAIRGFEAADSRRIVDPVEAAKTKALSTSFAVIQTCSPERDSEIKDRLDSLVNESAKNFFDAAATERLVSTLLVLGKIPYADTAKDQESKAAETKMIIAANEAASVIKEKIQKLKRESGFIQLEAQILAERKEKNRLLSEAENITLEIEKLTRSLKSGSYFGAGGMAPTGVSSYGSAGLGGYPGGVHSPSAAPPPVAPFNQYTQPLSDLYAFRSKAELSAEEYAMQENLKIFNRSNLLYEKHKDLSKRAQTIDDKHYKALLEMNKKISIEERRITTEQTLKLCADGKCIRDVKKNLDEKASFDTSELFFLRAKSGNMGLKCNPEEILRDLMKGACLGMPALVSLNMAKTAATTKSAQSGQWQSNGEQSGGHAVNFKGIDEKDGEKVLIFSNSWHRGDELAVPFDNICSVNSIDYLLYQSPIRNEPISELAAFNGEHTKENSALYSLYRSRKDALIKPREKIPVMPRPQIQRVHVDEEIAN